MNARYKPLWLFLLLLLLFPAIATLVKVVDSGMAALERWEWALLIALPLLAWLWLRHFSVLGCREGCRLPGDR